MTKKKQVHKSAEEVKVEMDEQSRQEKLKECAQELEQVMQKHGFALQCYLERNDYAGDAPRVRLVPFQRPTPNPDVEA